MESNGIAAKGKMSGYLEKKSKMRMVSSWKKYWFVLQDRLLLFYRSKEEYEAISSCKGSINLSPPCTIKSYPSVQHAFQIVTRATSFTMRAETSQEQKSWMQTIMLVLNQDPPLFHKSTPCRLNHFRYSLDDLVPSSTEKSGEVHKKNCQNELIQRLQKMGNSYGGSLETISKLARKPPSAAIREETSSSSSSSDNSVVYRKNKSLSYENFYERISSDSTRCLNKPRFDRVPTLLVDNENYSVPVKKSNSLCGERCVSSGSLMVENAFYCQNNNNNNVEEEEVIYAEPINIDHNENVMVDNAIYAPAENLYELIDDEANRKPPERVKSLEGRKLKKSKSFIKSLWWRKGKAKSEEKCEAVYDEVKPKVEEKFVMNDANAVQMLNELTEILKTKKSDVAKMLSNTTTTSPTNPSRDKPQDGREETAEICPPLPNKTSRSPPPKAPRSLDEILEDLDKDLVPPTDPKNNIKRLIEKFDGDCSSEVTLRNKHYKNQMCRSQELDYLLEELAKITHAPILTPGATNSLMDPTLDDEQFLNLVPRRQRRLSEPDYDIPRPLTFERPKESKKEEEMSFSITPDSLEVNETPIVVNDISYNSHQYFNNNYTKDLKQDLKCFTTSNTYYNDKIIYAVPKSYISVATHIVNTCQNICSAELGDEHTIIYKTVKNIVTESPPDEIFADSLEINESLTKL